jgi:hypothetical protein
MLSSYQTTQEATRPPSRYKSRLSVGVARFCATPAFALHPHRAVGAKKKGLDYEREVVRWLELECNSGDWTGFPKQWIEYTNDRNVYGVCQPDYFAINARLGTLLIVEIKLTRRAEAWWQLNALYEPVLRYIFPAFHVAKLEIASNIRNVDTPTPVRCVTWWDQAQVGRTSFLKVDFGRR